jgi:glucan phosphoethanolaminetransferase (alkaline phosphatase superfamily)
MRVNGRYHKAIMSPSDHNKTLAIIYSLLGGFFTLPVFASPWIIAKNVDRFPSARREGQVLIATIVFCIVLLLALLFLLIAFNLYRRKTWGRKLALVASVVLLPLCPPIAIYTWWFMHSDGGKQMYGESTRNA